MVNLHYMPDGISGFRRAVLCFLFLPAAAAISTNVYVVPPGTPGAAPDGIYITWPTAATNIQDAIGAINTNGGNIVYISNGVYHLTNEIAVNKGVVLRSWSNGVVAPESTILDGANFDGKPVTNRVLNINHAAAELDGLTIQGGTVTNLYGGGMLITACRLVTNCIVKNNTSVPIGYGGGGIAVFAPWNGKITHSLISSNYAGRGAGIFIRYFTTGIVEHCTIVSNYAAHGSYPDGGGGLYLLGNNTPPYPANAVTARWCTITHNTAYACGGGINILYNGGIVDNCLIASNYQVRTTSSTRRGSGVYFWLGTEAAVRNSLIVGNSNLENNFAVELWRGGRLENCTVANNRNGGLSGLLTDPIFAGNGTGVVVNSIIYSNMYYDVYYTNQVEFTNCCASAALAGPDNITNYPRFINPESDFNLDIRSPCINAGWNLPWMHEAGAVDLNGHHRVDAIHKRVDMGCYEYLFGGAIFQIR